MMRLQLEIGNCRCVGVDYRRISAVVQRVTKRSAHISLEG